MTDKKLEAEIQDRIIKIHADMMIKVLENCLKRKPFVSDMFRIKLIPIREKKYASLISFDDVIVGVIEGHFQRSEDNENIKYVCDFIPAEDYKG
jgi:hypothetical protein